LRPCATSRKVTCSIPDEVIRYLIDLILPVTDIARLNAVIGGSNPTQGMDVCVCVFSVCVVLCVGSGLATGLPLVQAVLPSV
jgi:hypothetical protein